MFVLLLFPSGRLPSRRWRPVAWLGWVAVVLTTVGNLFAPGVLPDTHSVNPLGVGGPLGAVFDALQAAFGFVLFTGLAALASLIFRYRRADAVEREQLRWLVYAVGLIILAVIAGSVVMELVRNGDLATNIQNAIVSFALSAVPLAIGFAVLKYRLYDIDIVINKTLVFGALAAVHRPSCTWHRRGARAAIGTTESRTRCSRSPPRPWSRWRSSPSATRVQRFANRLVYGERATPYEVLARFSERIAGTYATEDVLARHGARDRGGDRRRARRGLAAGRRRVSWPRRVAGRGPAHAGSPLGGGELPTLPGADRAWRCGTAASSSAR